MNEMSWVLRNVYLKHNGSASFQPCVDHQSTVKKEHSDWLVHYKLNSHELSCPKSQTYYVIVSNDIGVPLGVHSQLFVALGRTVFACCLGKRFVVWKILQHGKSLELCSKS